MFIHLDLLAHRRSSFFSCSMPCDGVDLGPEHDRREDQKQERLEAEEDEEDDHPRRRRRGNCLIIQLQGVCHAATRDKGPSARHAS
ncbi:hypothetical protein EYF80_027954 [Liparis tanakae]|uniref:Uncharacterized protein n=1 Tax=Liparis tanakae TaxID=230148 RepID=A0A4Z2H7E9_9TELE|nr:hypothetical protein EYF80_027954 [Liparis tanakae]